MTTPAFRAVSFTPARTSGASRANHSLTPLRSTSRTFACALVFFCAAVSVTSSAQTFTSLFGFNGTNGANPYAVLVSDPTGNLYGTTQFGGAYGQGEVYKIAPDGTETVLHSFCSDFPTCSDGSQPFGGLVLATNGIFYGTTLHTVFRITPAGDLTTLYTFCSLSGCADGEFPYDSLVQGSDGNFYGTTALGGTDTQTCGGSCGTVFKITPEGALTTLHTFHGLDGWGPLAGLILGGDGNFYGTAPGGGAHKLGVAFQVTSSGTYTLLHSFNGADGEEPSSSLLLASDGNFYGSTANGGSAGYGVVFKMSSAGKLAVLRSFDNTDGSAPGNLVQVPNGNFYGVTGSGGNPDQGIDLCSFNGCGTIFELTRAGSLTTLYKFCSQTDCADGSGPSGLTLAADGKLYGATVLGGSTACGADGSCGTVFRFTAK